MLTFDRIYSKKKSSDPENEKLSGLKTPQTGAFRGSSFLKERPPSDATPPRTALSFLCKAYVIKKPSTSCSPKSRFDRPTVSPRPCKVRPHVLHRPCSLCTREGLSDCHFLFAITQTPITVPLGREQPQKKERHLNAQLKG